MDFHFSRPINRLKKHSDLINKLTKKRHPDSNKPLFLTIKELMFFAAAIGFINRLPKPIDHVDFKEKEDIQQHIFGSDSNSSLIHLIGLADNEKLEILKKENSGSLIKIFEEYANGGLDYITEREVLGDETGEQTILNVLNSLRLLELPPEEENEEVEEEPDFD